MPTLSGVAVIAIGEFAFRVPQSMQSLETAQIALQLLETEQTNELNIAPSVRLTVVRTQVRFRVTLPILRKVGHD